MPSDYAGNTLGTARELDITPNPQAFQDWVGSTDTNDYYRFSLNGRSSFNLTLNELSADANVQLRNSSGSLIGASYNTGTAADTINTTLEAGTYYVRVAPVSGANTTYYLSLSAPLDPGNTISTAHNITVDSTFRFRTLSDWVGNSDTNDYYRFSLSDRSSVNFTLHQLSADANVQLRNSSGSLIGASYNTGTAADTINTTLEAGTYYVRVAPVSGANTTYYLGWSATLDNAGNTLSTARNITVDSISSTYGDLVGNSDTNDYYRFSLSNRSSFNLTLNGLSADANVQLRNSSGSLISASYNTGTSADTINTALEAGTYYIRIAPVSGANTAYNLNVSATPILSGSDWFTANLGDTGIIDIARSLADDGNLSRNDMINIFRNAGDAGVIDASELTDLRTIVTNASRFNLQDYVRVLSNKVVNSDVANQTYQGSTLGNLYAGSSATQMEGLINKWFLGSDRPTTSNTYRYASGSLFQNGISYQDVKQGTVGDCYFLAGLAATALRSSSTIQSMFIDNGDNTYTVRFYRDGVADYVTVDRYLPTTSWGTFAYANMGGSYNSSSNELWVALAEKAYAQINESGWTYRWNNDHSNSYEGISGGVMSHALSHITGRTSQNLSLNFDSIVNAFNSGKLIGLGTNFSGVASNIVPGHAYVLTGYNSSTQKFTLFNPWGVNGGYYSGNFKPGTIELTWSQIAANFSVSDYTNN